MLQLVIGNRNYSSWSLRAWLYLRESGIAFETIRIPLFTEGWPEAIARYSPAGRVPVLIDAELAIWDSLAIIEHLRERTPEAVGWPRDPRARAEARSISAEMHSGFLAIRGELPQNLRVRHERPPAELSQDARSQIERVQTLWRTCRETHAARGEWLFGEFSIADVMYAPVALRFVTYGIQTAGAAQDFVDSVQKLETVREWMKLSAEESEELRFIDELVPASDGPLTLG